MLEEKETNLQKRKILIKDAIKQVEMKKRFKKKRVSQTNEKTTRNQTQ